MSESLATCVELEILKNAFIKGWGYQHPQALYEEETYRTNFRRQRDRILYSGGFRRLQDKTQVIAAMKSGDHRTRLTHTLEVEQIAISISDALGLNSDLVSGIAMGHDVGHTPFGHAVERVLNDKLKSEGGFSHAVQSVKYLSEEKMKEESVAEEYREDVTTLRKLIFEGILKHDTDVYTGDYDDKQFDCSEFRLDEAGILEMQVVYWADKIAYLTHDFEDFFNTTIYENAKKNNSGLQKEIQDNITEMIQDKDVRSDFKTFELRDLIRNIISELIKTSFDNIMKMGVSSPDIARMIATSRIKEREIELAKVDEYWKECKENYCANKSNEEIEEMLKVKQIKSLAVEISESENSDQKAKNKEIENKIKAFKKIKKDAFLDGLIINVNDDYRKNYNKLRIKLNDFYLKSPEITRSDAKAKKIATCLFDDFVDNTDLLPLNIRKRIDENSIGHSKKRTVANYISSMTDKYAELVYSDLNAIGGNYEY